MQIKPIYYSKEKMLALLKRIRDEKTDKHELQWRIYWQYRIIRYWLFGKPIKLQPVLEKREVRDDR